MQLSNLIRLKPDSRPDGGLTENTVEQIAVEPSIGSRARPTAKGRRSWPQLGCSPAKKFRLKLPVQAPLARVIQSRQKNAAQRNLLADDQAASTIGTSIYERPHKKFCSPLCANALRAAATRVERYYKSRGCIGQSPFLHRLRKRWHIAFVRRLLRYYGTV